MHETQLDPTASVTNSRAAVNNTPQYMPPAPPAPTHPPGVRTIDAHYRLKIFIQIAMLYLEDDDPVSAETYIKKASSLIASSKDHELELQYKTSYARIMDAKRRWLYGGGGGRVVGVCVSYGDVWDGDMSKGREGSDQCVCGGDGGGCSAVLLLNQVAHARVSREGLSVRDGAEGVGVWHGACVGVLGGVWVGVWGGVPEFVCFSDRRPMCLCVLQHRLSQKVCLVCACCPCAVLCCGVLCCVLCQVH